MSSIQNVEQQVATLRWQILDTESHLESLKLQLQHVEAQTHTARDLDIAYQGGMPLGWQQETFLALSHSIPGAAQSIGGSSDAPDRQGRPLLAEEYHRYGRQLIMPEIGLKGQLRLKKARVLIVGAGGLGCPAAAYLAGAGVGTLGLVDGDVVEISNLHRQIAHSTSRVGVSKVESAIKYLKRCVEIPTVPMKSKRIPAKYLNSPDSTQIFATCLTRPILFHKTRYPSLTNMTSYSTVPTTRLRVT